MALEELKIIPGMAINIKVSQGGIEFWLIHH